MYHFFKRIIKTVLGQNLLLKLEWPMRSLVELFYAGNKVECPLCQGKFRKFVTNKNQESTEQICPKCGSLARKRLLWLYIKNELKAETKQKDWLHFTPHRYLAKKMKKIQRKGYTITDYGNNSADEQFDITQMECNDASFDCVICYHVLEHVAEDKKAISELYRVLKPRGVLLTQVPHKLGETLEDPTVTDPKERLEKFGQEDHVRYYGTDDFVQRLEHAGFCVEKNEYAKNLGEQAIKKFALNANEVIFVCTK